MTQEERDRLVTLKKAKKRMMTQQEAAENLEVTPRHVRRLITGLREQGDKSVIHGLKGQVSNRRIEEAEKEKAIEILSAEVYQGFGPTLAMEHLRDKHAIAVSKETVRQWMLEAKLWRRKKARVEQPHLWRARRSRYGELVLTRNADVRPTLSLDKVCRDFSPVARTLRSMTGWRGGGRICI
jgi:hypothetical protein